MPIAFDYIRSVTDGHVPIYASRHRPCFAFRSSPVVFSMTSDKPVDNGEDNLDPLTLAQVMEQTELVHPPLIASITPLTSLRKEYEKGTTSFIHKIDWLIKQGWKGIRRTRGDGDCFYRSLAFAYIERIMRSEDRDFAVGTAKSTLESSKPLLKNAGFEPLVFEDWYEVFVSLIQQVVTPEEGNSNSILTPKILLEAFQSDEVSNSIVVYLRLMTSAQIRADPDTYSPFLLHAETMESMPVRDFCERFVEAVNVEADHVQIQALSRALHLNIQVAYLDGRGPSDEVPFVNFDNRYGDGEDNGIKDLVLLYRPGHYDILERRSKD